ncbi:MAG: N-acetylmuramoyl-L-alanine amidase [Deltaproteobacteria bacterium]|nr:N-acetylmuramoyl-L-alanine amidase [Deltaproteobacteria bacterium]
MSIRVGKIWRFLLGCCLALCCTGCESLLARLSGDSQEFQSKRESKGSYRRAPVGVAARYALGSQSLNHTGLRILLDPGHGGEDLGAIGPDGLVEKDIVLDVAFKLEPLLKRNLGAEVFMTRRTDRALTLAERAAMANDYEADLFISLHVNASQRKRAYGLEVYYLDNTDDSSSIKLAKRENNTVSAGRLPGDLEFMLSDLIQNAKLDDSIVLAHSIGRAIYGRVAPNWRGIKYLGVKKAPFYVLVGVHMPCVLVEMFFVDHPRDAAKLARADFRQELAYGLYLGIQDYLRRRDS